MARSFLFHHFKAIMLLVAILMTYLDISDAQVGVSYGILGNNLPSPAEVVALCQQNNIRRIQIFTPDAGILNALRGSGISVVLGVANEDIPAIGKDASVASTWVSENVLAYNNVNFRYIAVGNEIHTSNVGLAQSVVPAMQNIQSAVAAAGLANSIKVSTVLSNTVLGTSFPPSAGTFNPAISWFINPIIQLLKQNNSPFLVNVYPYYALAHDPRDISLPYALFTSPVTVVHDGPYQYQNLFDAMVDSIYAALERAGAGGLEVVVSETGWPTEGAYFGLISST